MRPDKETTVTANLGRLRAVWKPHQCFTTLELYTLRQAAEMPSVTALRLQDNLVTNCTKCWDSVEKVRGMPENGKQPSGNPHIHLLRTLTTSNTKNLTPTHRRALREVRTDSFGLQRLLFEEVLRVGRSKSTSCISELESVLALLGDLPEELWAWTAWHDLKAELESSIAVVWAQRHHPECARAALQRATVYRSLGSGSKDCAVNLLKAEAICKFHNQAEVAEWGPIFEEVLALVKVESDKPRRLEILNEFSCFLGESRQLETSHRCLLEGLQLAEEMSADYPLLHLRVLHNLAKLELYIAFEGRECPPNFGLFYCLAMSHFQRASCLYKEWAPPSLVQEGEALCQRLALVGELWAAPDGLRREWHRLTAGALVPALSTVQLLGLAAAVGDEQFMVLHGREIQRALAESTAAQKRLLSFRQKLLKLLETVDEGGQKVVADWLNVVRWVGG